MKLHELLKAQIKYVVEEAKSHFNLSHVLDIITSRAFEIEKAMTSLRETLSKTEALLNALAHLHGHGILHGDVKPENCLIWDAHMPMLFEENEVLQGHWTKYN